MDVDFYAVLGEDDDATQERLQAAYRTRVSEFHPDKNDHPDAEEHLAVLLQARDVLLDEQERERYDELGHSTYVANHCPSLSTPALQHIATATMERREEASNGTESADGIVSRSRANRIASDGRNMTNGGSNSASGVSWERSDRRRAARETSVTEHLLASPLWIPIVLSAVLYGLGLGRFLGVNNRGINLALTALGGGDLAALHDRRMLLSTTEFLAESGLTVFPYPSFGTAFVVGAIALVGVMAWTVMFHRRETNWSPSVVHIVGCAAPACALLITVMLESIGQPIGIPTSPVWLDVMLLMGLPAVTLLSFFLNRFVLVIPIRREG